MEALPSLLMPAVVERLLLLANHVLAAEPQATARLARHAGRSLSVGWLVPPGPWPRPPELALRITPAGLVEQQEPPGIAPASAGLRVTVELPAPHEFLLQWLQGARPKVHVEGDAELAADIAWLSENLRWDVEADLARAIGDAPAHQLAQLGRALRDGLRRASLQAVDLWRQRPGAGSAASQ
jgi:ubiquinone biosynthesis protein UbiJ